MIALGIVILYILVGMLVSAYYLTLCLMYSIFPDEREEIMQRYGDEEGKRLLRIFTKPGKIIKGFFMCLYLWPTVLKGYIEK